MDLLDNEFFELDNLFDDDLPIDLDDTVLEFKF